jgi:arginyl-tRNA synthetase
MTPQHAIEVRLKTIFKEAGLDESLGSLKISDRPDLCDYQCNGALSGAKALKCNPRELGEKLSKKLQESFPDLEVDLAGPGFINIKLSNHSFTNYLNTEAFGNFSVPLKKVIIDYGGPNVAKPMHVGHLRSTIIGETLKRLCQFVGHNVIGDIHMGDWGTQMGMIIYELSLRHPALPYFDSTFQGPYPKESPVTLDDLQEIYPVISAKCKKDESIAEKARLATVELQQGRPGYRALWQHFVDISVQDMKIHLKKLGVDFDQWFGESRYQDQIPPLLEKLAQSNIAQISEGALIMEVAKDQDKAPTPPLLLQKKDGGFLYATTDLATIQERVSVFGAERIIYVVDGRQGLHFEQVFRGARKIGFDAEYDFIGFGTMNGPDGKPFKTRAGGVMRLGELIDMLILEAKKRITDAGLGKDFSDEMMGDIAQKIGIAALKFADLQHDPIQNYQFDLEKFMKFEGKTGPYILYAGVRMQSMLQKATDAGLEAGDIVAALGPTERDLVLALTRFDDYIMRAYEKLTPHILCDYAFDLCQKFSRFYQNAHILNEKDKTLQGSRISITKKALSVLQKLSHLLGIDIPERM